MVNGKPPARESGETVFSNFFILNQPWNIPTYTVCLSRTQVEVADFHKLEHAQAAIKHLDAFIEESVEFVGAPYPDTLLEYHELYVALTKYRKDSLIR